MKTIIVNRRCENCNEIIKDGDEYIIWNDEIVTHKKCQIKETSVGQVSPTSDHIPLPDVCHRFSKVANEGVARSQLGARVTSERSDQVTPLSIMDIHRVLSDYEAVKKADELYCTEDQQKAYIKGNSDSRNLMIEFLVKRGVTL